MGTLVVSALGCPRTGRDGAYLGFTTMGVPTGAGGVLVRMTDKIPSTKDLVGGGTNPRGQKEASFLSMKLLLKQTLHLF